MSGWDEVEGVPTREGVRGQVGWEVSKSRESDVLVWWPSIWKVPLETSLDEGSGNGSIVPVHDHVDGGEGTKGLALIAQYIRGNDSNPEGVESGDGVEAVTGIGSQVVVIESEFVGIPEEIENAGMELRSSVTMGCSLGGRSGLLEVVGKDLVRLVWKILYELTVHSTKSKRYVHKIEFRSTGIVFLIFSVLSLGS